jgi:hypothetical protein
MTAGDRQSDDAEHEEWAIVERAHVHRHHLLNLMRQHLPHI